MLSIKLLSYLETGICLFLEQKGEALCLVHVNLTNSITPLLLQEQTSAW